MSLRKRFAILFTVTVAILLLITSFTIYFLYYDHRENEYSTKLRNEVKLTFDEFKDKLLKNGELDNSITFECGDNTLIDKEVYIFSGEKKLMYSYLKATHYLPTNDFLDKIKKEKDVYYKIDEREFVAEYFEASKKYVIASSIDKDGFNKLTKLRYYLILVCLCVIAFGLLISYFIASAALQPLSHLNLQIQQTTEQNLSHQISVGNGKDEISKIATNYNSLMQRLDKAFDIQKNFVHHASHELRTPLATMHATTELALNKELTLEEYKQTLESLQQEQNNLIELTNSLLLLYQFEKLQFKPNLNDIRIDEVVYEAISFSQKNFHNIIIDFSFENIEDEDSLVKKGNEVLLKAAFSNLIKNAFLYSKDKTVKIKINVVNKKVEIKFENTGKHLTPSLIENMKQPFSSAENIGIKGVGLGLSIVYRITELHKGELLYKALENNVNLFVIKI